MYLGDLDIVATERDGFFNERKAAMAQRDYCRDGPMFAPSDGICYRCGKSIYMPIKGRDGMVSGYTVEQAGSRRITGCPHCNYSFCE